MLGIPVSPREGWGPKLAKPKFLVGARMGRGYECSPTHGISAPTELSVFQSLEWGGWVSFMQQLPSQCRGIAGVQAKSESCSISTPPHT